ncbi:hypothetical protein BD779DRAFT_1514059 [Infundibulicybe gibba]|nr:hypothetical protein BD779DRAFT_1514059 [Infundibulicybe gibba]
MIFATGFDVVRGPKAYLGTTLPGFPNFFTILGACKINYIIRLITPVLQQKITSVEVTAQATDAYNAKIHQKLSGSVFTQCSSYYRVGGNGKVAMIFPGPISLFWWWARRPNWTHYTVMKGSVEKAYNVTLMRTQVLSTVVLVLVACWLI